MSHVTHCYHCGKETQYLEHEIIMETGAHNEVVRCQHCGALVMICEENNKEDARSGIRKNSRR